MSFDTSWDVNKYHYHYELPHHWELKRKFIQFHKNKYPEDRLVCLAQIFCNVHELGCRYGDEVMELIDELTKGITERNEKFDSRSFSLASDAVEERVKAFTGQNKSTGALPGRRTGTLDRISFVKSAEPDKRWESSSSDYDSRKRSGDEDSLNGKPPGKVGRYKDGGREDPPAAGGRREFFSWEAKRAAATVREVVESGPFGKVVVFRSSVHSDNVINIIERAASAAYMRTSYDYLMKGENHTCKFCLDGMYVSDGVGRTQKLAKEAACKLALERLEETSYTIEVKATYIGGETVERELSNNAPRGGEMKAGVEIPLADSNIGSKMLKMMGWTGGGLGKDQQGIEEPIKPYDQNIRRGGLGITNFSDFRRKITRIIEEYAHSNDKNDLVFSPDFSKDERKTIHDLVRKYNLKSRSYGKDEEIRHIVVFRKIQPLEIVEDLLACGGETEKYRLISPNPKMK